MADDLPPLDLEEPEQGPGFPWLPVAIVAGIFLLLAAWIIMNKSGRHAAGQSAAAMEQQIVEVKGTLDAERDKLFELSEDLKARQNAIAAGEVPDKKRAIEEYNKVAKQQVEQREKVKGLVDDYNAKIAALEEAKGR